MQLWEYLFVDLFVWSSIGNDASKVYETRKSCSILIVILYCSVLFLQKEDQQENSLI